MLDALIREEFKTLPFVTLARKLAVLFEELSLTLYEHAEEVDPTPPKYDEVIWAVHLPGKKGYNLTPMQTKVMVFLQQAWKNRNAKGKIDPTVEEGEILRAVGANPATVVKLRDLFRGSKAWGRLIKRQKKNGFYYLASCANSDLERCEQPATLRRQIRWK